MGLLSDHCVDGGNAVLEGREQDAMELLLGGDLVHSHDRLSDDTQNACVG